MIYTIQYGSYTFPNQTFELQGLPLDTNIDESKIPRKHGSVILTPYLKSRSFTIKGVLHDNNAETVYTQLSAMQAALYSGENALQFRSDRYVNCYTQKINPEFVKGTDKAVQELNISMIAQDPFMYSAGASYSYNNTAVKGTTKTFSIYNGGNVNSEPIISFYASGATFSNDLVLTNLTNNQQMTFGGVMGSGQTLQVNSKTLEVTNNLVDGLSNFSGDFITLDAGTNSFQYVGATISITHEYKYRWY